MENIKRNIAIVCGGDSSEHDVSMNSANGLYSFFDKERYNVYIVDVEGQNWHVNFEDGTTAPVDRNDFSFVKDGKAVVFDYAYITIHGTPGENGLMQGYFELIGVPYSTSGVLVEAMTFDKYVLNRYLSGYGINVARSLLLRRGEENKYSEEEIERIIGMPCFVKPAADDGHIDISRHFFRSSLRVRPTISRDAPPFFVIFSIGTPPYWAISSETVPPLRALL